MIDNSVRLFKLLILSELSYKYLGSSNILGCAIRYGRPSPGARWPGRRPRSAGFRPALLEDRAAVRQIARYVERG